MSGVEAHRSAVEQIRNIFPSETVGRIEQVLESQGGNAERAVEHFLWLQQHPTASQATSQLREYQSKAAAHWRLVQQFVQQQEEEDDEEDEEMNNYEEQDEEDLEVVEYDGVGDWIAQEMERIERRYHAQLGMQRGQMQQVERPIVVNERGANRGLGGGDNRIAVQAAEFQAVQQAQEEVGNNIGETDGKCVVCMINEKKAGFAHENSVHKCVCRECSQLFKPGDHCPLCRKSIQMIIRDFYE